MIRHTVALSAEVEIRNQRIVSFTGIERQRNFRHVHGDIAGEKGRRICLQSLSLSSNTTHEINLRRVGRQGG